MKDFSAFSNWLASQEASQVPAIVNSAISKGESMNQMIRGAPSQYNNSFQSVFLYHYDNNGVFVDDTTQEMESIPDSIISDVKAKLQGYSDYFQNTKSGFTVGGSLTQETVYEDIQFGQITLNRDEQTGSITSVDDLVITITYTPVSGISSTGSLWGKAVIPLGHGYSAEVLIKMHYSYFHLGGVNYGYVDQCNVYFNILMDQVVLCYLEGSITSSSPSTVAPQVLQIASSSMNFNVGAPSGVGSISVINYAGTTLANSPASANNQLLMSCISGVSTNSSVSSEIYSDVTYSISGDQDLIQAIASMFISPTEAIARLP
jgi:hypothetical protein